MTDKAGASAASADDDELSVPRASVNKMIRELAPNMRISNETRELIINCCNEFIHLLATESNSACNSQQKKTIAPEHVLLALENLGFTDYLSEVKECVDEAKQVAIKKRRQSTKLENLGIPEEELLRQQQELFAKAREEQAALEQKEWEAMQQQANMAAMQAGQGQFAYPGQMMPTTSYNPQQQQMMTGNISMQQQPSSSYQQSYPLPPAASASTSSTLNASQIEIEDDDEDDDDDY